jgi:hypothetical protein
VSATGEQRSNKLVKEQDMMMVAKMNGKIVEIVKVVETVAFSTARGWVMICTDFEQAERKKSQFKWLPATTKFEWVREFNFAE